MFCDFYSKNDVYSLFEQSKDFGGMFFLLKIGGGNVKAGVNALWGLGFWRLKKLCLENGGMRKLDCPCGASSYLERDSFIQGGFAKGVREQW